MGRDAELPAIAADVSPLDERSGHRSVPWKPKRDDAAPATRLRGVTTSTSTATESHLALVPAGHSALFCWW
jgi:hypothetical protein